MIGEPLEPGHLVGVPRRGCASKVCAAAGMTGHLAHSPCRVLDCIQRTGTSWHGSQHIVACRGCEACVPREDTSDGR